TFTRALPHPGEDRNTAVFGRDIVDEFRNQDRFAYSSPTEQTDFATFGDGRDQVDNFDARLKNFHGRILFFELWRRPMNRCMFGKRAGLTINRLARDIEHPAERLLAHWHRNRRYGIDNGVAPFQPIG